jgi:hypothetical protein
MTGPLALAEYITVQMKVLICYKCLSECYNLWSGVFFLAFATFIKIAEGQLESGSGSEALKQVARSLAALLLIALEDDRASRAWNKSGETVMR